MPNYRYIASYSRFIPDKHDADGRSLMAEAGMVVQWDSAPSSAEWVETDEPVTWGAPAPAAPAEDPVPVVLQEAETASEPVPAPEPAPAPVAPQAPPEFAPPPVPEPVPATPQPYVASPAFGPASGGRNSGFSSN